jgi:hypothetical protein
VTHEDQLEAIRRIVSKCQKAGFWGTITIQLSGGNVVESRLTQTIKPEKVLCSEDSILCLEDDALEKNSGPSLKSLELSNPDRQSAGRDDPLH